MMKLKIIGIHISNEGGLQKQWDDSGKVVGVIE